MYDDYGNLTYVLPPKSEPTSAMPDATELSELCYQYKYDDRNRLVEKKIPGKGWEYIVYDKLDRPVLTQDANQRVHSPDHWLVTKYDALGRVAYTAIYKTNSSRSAVQTQYNNKSTAASNYEEKVNSGLGYGGTYYTNNDYPVITSSNDILTVNYYDDYTFNKDGLTIPSSYEGQTIVNYNNTDKVKTRSLATGSKVRVLGTTQWITTVTGYDTRGRAIYTATKNPYLQTTDIVKSKLDFVGKVDKTVSTHTKTGKSTITTEDNFEYDHTERLLTQKQKINNNTANEELIVSNTYDDLGQLITKGVGNKASSSTRLQSVDYTYNVRGWLKQINNPASLGTKLFAFKINYNTVNHSGTKLYNGNISETEWRTNNSDDNSLKWYRYNYDALNRIISATDNLNRYSINTVKYDKNGNLTRLKRMGHRVAQPNRLTSSHFGIMDYLDYNYYPNSNKLQSVQELSGGHSTYGFKNGSTASTEYVYDTNGNLTSDANKGITSVLYNHLNMPTEIKFNNSNTQKINYVYAADRSKVRKIVDDNGNITTTDYAKGYIYENNTLKRFFHPEGYVEPVGNDFSYVYQYKDLKNTVRLAYNDADGNGTISQGEIKREYNYYPFGLTHVGYNNVVVGVENNTETFQGQEFTKDLNLNTHHWKYRVSDPSLGRFWQIDPLAMDYVYNSTYAFSENRVIDGVELEGLEYVNANEAKIQTRGSGRVSLKVENLNWFSRGTLRQRNENPANWPRDEAGRITHIGISNDIGSFSIESRKPVRGAKTNQMKIQNPTTKKRTIDKRFKTRKVGGAATGKRGIKAARGIGVVAALDFGLQGTIIGLGLNDLSDIKKQGKLLGLANEDLQSAIEDGIIPPELLNLKDLTSILNVIFQGESNSDNPALKKLGLKVFDTYNPNHPRTRLRSLIRAQLLSIRELETLKVKKIETSDQ